MISLVLVYIGRQKHTGGYCIVAMRWLFIDSSIYCHLFTYLLLPIILIYYLVQKITKKGKGVAARGLVWIRLCSC